MTSIVLTINALALSDQPKPTSCDRFSENELAEFPLKV
jgi:hypothetical protein